MLILRAKTALNVAICMIFFNIFLDNGVMNTPKRRILSLVFTVLCFKNSFNTKIIVLKVFFHKSRTLNVFGQFTKYYPIELIICDNWEFHKPPPPYLNKWPLLYIQPHPNCSFCGCL